MTKRILSLALVVMMVLSISSYAFAADNSLECSNISFVDANGDMVTALSTEPITAKVEITKNTSSEKAVLMVCSYQNDMLNGVWHASEDEDGKIEVEFALETTENTVVKATVLGSLEKLSNPSVSAEATLDSVELSRIVVNGEIIENYSDDVTAYIKKVEVGSPLNIAAVPVDGGTKVEIEKATTVPGVSTVKLTSAGGSEKNIDIITYSDEAQLTAPTKLSYIVDGDTYEIDVDPNQKEYEVILDDNTFYVTLEAEVLSIADLSVGVKDINHKALTYGGVSYVPGSLAKAYTDTLVERQAIDNLIPIKNEETHAIVNVEYDGNKVPYTIIFKSKQPRLTAFNVNPEDQYTYKPVFISGAAMNNDNATPAGSDRNWAIANIPEQFIGGSLFALSNMGVKANGFLGANTRGEYFNFTADTPGTAYYFSSQPFENTGELAAAGWLNVNNVKLLAELLPDGYDNWKNASKTYNSFGNGTDGNPKNVIIMYEWGTLADRYSQGGLNGSILSGGAHPYIYVYAKTFDIGENVSVPHPGNVANKHMTDVVVVWDID